MNLSAYLPELLKTNDCVIIPDLGGFIANYQPSGYDELQDNFSPPAKEIVFSQKLKKNDGLLVNYVGEKEGVGYLEAREIVSEYVSEIQYRLRQGETVVFEQIGSLRFDTQNNLVFEPESGAGFQTESFGMDSFHFPPLAGKSSVSTTITAGESTDEPQEKSRSFWKYALLALPVLAAFYLIPKYITKETSSVVPPVSKPVVAAADSQAAHKPSTLDTAVNHTKPTVSDSVAPVQKSEKKIEETLMKEAANPPVHPKEEEQKVLVKASEEKPSIPDKVASTGKFHVVGGCFKVKENADKMADSLSRLGYHPLVSRMGGGFFRVTVESFQTRKEAEQSMIKLLSVDPEGGYWLKEDKH
ncbi:MAG: SPOR domain-containing protein [Marinilabiliales bacterium]|nr:SPOR domain-containing protein [Marinilabiliales bacterium]